MEWAKHRRITEHDDIAKLAWQTANLSRAKKIPKLEKLLLSEKLDKRETPQDVGNRIRDAFRSMIR